MAILRQSIVDTTHGLMCQVPVEQIIDSAESWEHLNEKSSKKLYRRFWCLPIIVSTYVKSLEILRVVERCELCI